MARPQLKMVDGGGDDEHASLVRVDNFILATRDSGYKGTTSAVAELIDNSIQADATSIDIIVADAGVDAEHPIMIAVRDNGTGMNPMTLRHALRFGGSSRFNDRGGMGRFGMGLPNASLSQARRVDVYTWQRKGGVITSHLDVDEIVAGIMKRVPVPREGEIPSWAAGSGSASGTIVVWSRCDRLDNRRASTLVKKLAPFLGRVFRHHIWSGTTIKVNGEKVKPLDPLFLRADAAFNGAELYAEPMEYEVEASNGKIGKVTVTFSELPVHEWHEFPNDEKRRRGISDGAGVSFVRAGREVELGWYMLGQKRRENYDDWWRCEVKFDAALDEVFGITHTKQQVRPDAEKLQDIVKDMEEIARVLNQRVRKAHTEIKAKSAFVESEHRAKERDQLLEPLARNVKSPDKGVKEIVSSHKALKGLPTPKQRRDRLQDHHRAPPRYDLLLVRPRRRPPRRRHQPKPCLPQEGVRVAHRVRAPDGQARCATHRPDHLGGRADRGCGEEGGQEGHCGVPPRVEPRYRHIPEGLTMTSSLWVEIAPSQPVRRRA